MSSDQNLHVDKLPEHIAIIMDGNGRWAKKRFLPRIEGHRAGAKTVRTITEECRKVGIKYLTLYAFSTENWQRPENEVNGLMKLFSKYLDSELKTLCKNGVRLKVIGDLEKVPGNVLEAIQNVEKSTEGCTDLVLTLAVSYGGRGEILSACKKIANASLVDPGILKSLNEKTFANYLYDPELPDPELLIRTSGENRISNFLLWQLAYSEIVVSKVYWPDFDKKEFFNCLEEFSNRNRRFGLTDEQLQSLTN